MIQHSPEPMKLPVRLTISKISSNMPNPEPVQIELVDDVSHTIILRARVALDVFAAALLGQGYVSGTAEVFSGAPWGKRCEDKTEIVPVTYQDTKEEALAKMRAFEVDGWQGRESDLFNHHNTEVGPSKSATSTSSVRIGQRVHFFRYVDVDK